MIPQTDDDFLSGEWYSYHWYPTSDDKDEECSEYQVRAYRTANEVVFASRTKDDGSYMLIRLTVDGSIATGTWYENTSPEGEFKGMMYSGAGQMLLDESGKTLEGMWAGVGIDHTTEKPRVYSGRWELRRERRSTT
jgi:hypothetical protein